MNFANLTKRCSRCGAMKTLEEFHDSAKGKYGKQPYCKRCNHDRSA